MSNEHYSDNVGGIRIKRLNYIFIVALAILSVLLLIFNTLVSREYNEISEISEHYIRFERDAKMVVDASDDLTDEVRLFVMTGRKSYLDAYFDEANVTKRRDLAIADLKELEEGKDLICILEKSVSESQNLMLLEYQAMRYAAEGYGIDKDSLPEEVRSTVLPEEAKNMSAEEKLHHAQELVYGDEYFDYKEKIHGYQNEYLVKATALMEGIEENGNRMMHLLLITQTIAIVLIVVLSAVLFIVILNLIVNPLDHAVSLITEGRRIAPLTGTFEIRYMSHKYNGFYDSAMEMQKRLKQDAERDSLTGVLNRRGYETVIEKLSTESIPLALLVFDADKFKLINDNFGHEIGDVVLKTFAKAMLDTFRSTDVVSRIGGDEFTVILLDVTEENRELIERKVNQINEILKNPTEEKCPAVSASVGCAFSPAGYNAETFTKADNMMYEVKNAGGGNIKFAKH